MADFSKYNELRASSRTMIHFIKLVASFVAGLAMLTWSAPWALGEVHVISGVLNNNLSGDYWCTNLDETQMGVLDDGQWHVHLLDENRSVAIPVQRAMQGSSNDELMWWRDVYYVHGKHLVRATVSPLGKLDVVSRTVLPEIGIGKWASGSASGERYQFVRGWTSEGVFIQTFDAETGELMHGWWSAVASGGRYNGIRNIVRADIGTTMGLAVSHVGAVARVAQWYALDGSGHLSIEPSYDNGRNAWSHPSWWNNLLVYVEPFHGRLEMMRVEARKLPEPTILLDQTALRELAGTTTWTTPQHLSTDADGVVMSIMHEREGDRKNLFTGIWYYDYGKEEAKLIWRAPEGTILPHPSDGYSFSDIPRVAMSHNVICWQHFADGDSEVDLMWTRLDNSPVDPVDPLDKLAERIGRLEEWQEEVREHAERFP